MCQVGVFISFARARTSLAASPGFVGPASLDFRGLSGVGDGFVGVIADRAPGQPLLYVCAVR